MTRTVAVLASVLLAWGALAGTARADIGAAIDLGRLDITEPLHPGDTVALPTLHVRNPGDEAAQYVMDAAPVEGGGAVDPSWVTFTPSTFELGPAQRQPVDAILTIPVGTTPGSYTALLRAGVSPAREGLGDVGAAAASRMTLTVADTSLLGALLRRLVTLVSGNLPWMVAAVALVGLVTVARRYRITMVPR